MHLMHAGAQVRVAQLGPDFVILAEAAVVPMLQADLVFRVDDTERCWPVDLPQGLAAPGQRTPIVNRA